jgi:hypothetical protein
MNKNSSRDFAMECLRGAGRLDTLEYLQPVHEGRKEASAIYVAWIDSRVPRTTHDFSSFNATHRPPVTVLASPTSLGSSALMVARSRSGL